MPIRKLSEWVKKWSNYVARMDGQSRLKVKRQSPRLEELEPRIVLDADWYIVPGSPLEQVSVTFKRTTGNTPYKNELGYYIVSDDAGRVEGLLPNDTGYASAVSRHSNPLFSTSSKVGATSKLTVAGGTKLGFYLVQNSSSSNWKTKNPNNTLAFKPVMFFSIDSANPDGADHVRTTTVGNETRFRWEDRTSLADRDFNDMMYSITSERPKTFTPGEVGQLAPTTYTLSSLNAGFKNELGIFMVDDAKGTINGLTPGQAGYSQAALSATSSQVLFARGAKKGTSITVDLPAGRYFGLYLVQNSTTSNFLTLNPDNKMLKGKPNVFFSIQAANPDKINHVQWSSKYARTIGFEDLWGGGDNDFNDLVASFKFGTPYTPVNPDNTPPSISEITSRTIPAGTAVDPISFTIDDRETSADQLVVAAASSNLSLLPASNILLGGSGSNRTVTLNPLAGKTGTTTVTLSVKDPNGKSSSRVFTLTVAEVAAFPSDLGGWTVAERGGAAGSRGTISLDNGQAVLVEGDSFLTTLSRSFTIPENPSTLIFRYAALDFDATDESFIKDAFEVALLDGAGNPLVATTSTGRDAFFNVSDGGYNLSASGVTIDRQTVSVDISAIPVGTVATLVFRLINNDADTSSTVTLVSTILPTNSTAAGPVKFFIVDGATSKTHRYGEEGLSSGTFDAAGSTLRGTASNPTGDKVWLIDAVTKRVSVFNAAGSQLASWVATDASSPQGVTVHNGDLWLVDRSSMKVLRFEGGMGRTTDVSSTDAFLLAPANTSPSDLVTDGSTVWVTDDALAVVFVYDMAGSLLGRWNLDGDNAAPSGITRNPSGGTDIWVVDRTTKAVYHYPNGANVRNGQLDAMGTFFLGPGNTSPEGIADPPAGTGGMSIRIASHSEQVVADSSIVLSGVAIAGVDANGKVDPVAAVTINGVPVDALDASGAFFASIRIPAGESSYTVTAFSSKGDSVSTKITLTGAPVEARVDFSKLEDLSGTFQAAYYATSYSARSHALYVDVSIPGISNYPVTLPLYVGVKNVSDPDVQVLSAAGKLPDGTPYYDFTGAVFGAPSLVFSNPNRSRFTYDLVFLGVNNSAPYFTSIPELEATVGREWHHFLYDATVIDPDRDPLTFSLISGPVGMTFERSQPWSFNWTPSESQIGNYPITIKADDGRGGTALLDFTISSELNQSNRPPVFSTLPIVQVNLDETYTYEVEVTDPDHDALSYSLEEFPDGMSIDAITGDIAWMPNKSQLGHANVTVKVDDHKGGFATQTFEVCVNAAVNNRPPIIVSKPGISHKLEYDRSGSFNYAPYKYQVTAIDSSHDQLTYSLVDNPLGMGIDSSSGLIAWYPLTLEGGNLLSNSSFEDVPSPPFFGEGHLPDEWNQYGTFSPGSDTFSLGADYGVPTTYGLWRSDVAPHSGNRFIGSARIPSPDFNVTEGIAQRLSDPLHPGSKYFASGYLLKSIHPAYLSDGGYRVYLSPSTVISDESVLLGQFDATTGKENWEYRSTLLSVPENLSFSEQYLLFVPYSTSLGSAYIGLDDISITLTNPPAEHEPLETVPITIRVDDGRGGYDQQSYLLTVSGLDPQSAPDLVISSVTQNIVGDTVTFMAKVHSDGSPVPSGIQVAFYNGNPAKGGQHLGNAITLNSIAHLQSESVSFSIPFGSVNDLWVRVDDNGTGVGTVPEYDETNNAFRAHIDLDPVNYAPKQTRQLDKTETTASVRTPYTLTLPVLDPDGDDITYIVLSGPEGLKVHESLGVVAWYPLRDQIGSHQAIIRATDAFGNNTLVPLMLTVATPNTAPIFTSTPSSEAATVDRLFEYHAYAQDAEQTDLTFSLVDPLPGMIISSSGLFTWTPPNATPSTVRIRVSDGKLTTDQVFILNVVPSGSNTNPTLKVEAPSLAWLGRTYVARLLGFDSDGDAVRYELVNGPTGMAVDAVTGILAWSPNAIGSETVRVKSIDGKGGETEAEFSVTITSEAGDNHAPLIISNPPRSAQIGMIYAYDLVARDPDGGPVVWSMVTGPQGMSVDSVRGTLRWIPAEDQTGTFTVIVRAMDQMLAFGEQTFTIQVSCSNAPPLISSRPPTIAFANEPYLYAVCATDPESDPLTFELTSAPEGMFFVPGTSIIRWTPTTAQAGSHNVVIRVMDQAGNETTQSFSLLVSTETPNHAPVITSRPLLGATIGQEYRYEVVASDSDGDSFVFTLTSAPVGMQIDATGLITWTPTGPTQTTVTVAVTDIRGGVAVQSYTITARENQAPVVDIIPDAMTSLNSKFQAVVRAVDYDGDALTFSLQQAPTGMTIDNEGRINWTPMGYPRTETVRVQVSDTAVLSTLAEFHITLIADTEAPKVSIALSRSSVIFGTAVQVHVNATDNIGIGSLKLTVTHDGITTDVAINATGIATFTPSVKGRYTFTVLATDTSGNTATSSAELVAIDPNATSDVRGSFTRLEMLTAPGVYRTLAPTVNAEDIPPELTYLTDIYGTVKSLRQPLAYWQLLMAPASDVDILNIDPNSSAWRLLKKGFSGGEDQLLGTFDPTMLQNDGYVLALVAYDVTGAGWVQPTVVSVTGNAKLGDFHLEFTDLTLPLNGIPITITRVYDSKATNTSGDFGYGWSLGVQNANIRETVPSGTGSGLFSNGQPFVSGRTKVYLTNPSGQRVGFTYTEEFQSGGIFSVNYKPIWVPDPGVTDKLHTDGLITRGAFGHFDYNPDIYHLTSPDGTTYEYDQTAGLKKISDTNGNTVIFTANAITHSGGRVITLERDGTGRITAIRLPEGNVGVRYRYNANGDLVEVNQVTKMEPVEQALTSQISYRVDRAHYLEKYIDANGNEAVKTNYDASGRLVDITNADGKTTRQQFDLVHFTETVVDARGNPTTITYNNRGNVVKTVQYVQSGNIEMKYEYGDPNNPDKETRSILVNGSEIVTTRSFDLAGNLLSETTPDGTTSYLYNSLNKVTQVTDTMGRITAYGYDLAGNLIRVATPNGEASSFTYDEQGHVKEFIDFKGNMTKFDQYCACGRPLWIQNPDLTFRTSTTNQYSQIMSTTDEKLHLTENEYDNQGRLVAVKTYMVNGGTPQVTRYEYTGTNQTKVIDPLGNVTRYEYDKLNRRTKIIDAEGGIVEFTYDENGNQRFVKDPVGNVTEFRYDEANRVKEEIDPLGNSKFFAYDAAGNQVKITDRMGRVREFVYDGMNRQTAEIWKDSMGGIVRTISSTYDHGGNLRTTADPDAELSYTYDSMNRMVTATTVYPGTNVAPVTLFYGYDANGNVTSVRDNTGVIVASTYDNRNRLDVRNWSGGGIDVASVKYKYFENSQVETLTRFSDITQTNKVGSTSYDYWENGLTKKITHKNGTDAVLVNYDYLYNDAGLLKQETHHGKTYVYGYDKTGQLLSSTINGTLSESFSYDKNGNRKTSTGFNGNQTYQTGLGNQLKNDGKFSYVYDKEGNLSSKTELATGKMTSYTWDHRNRLTKVVEGTSSSEYAYDPTGRRIKQMANSQTLYTVYNGDHAWVDVKGDGSVAARYVFGDRIDDIIARWQSGNVTAWYLEDRLATVRDLAGANGAIINHTDYSTFGHILTHTSVMASDRYAFTSRELTTIDDVYYFRARQYNALIGRFLSVDKYGFASHDCNLYRYTVNSPLNATDPTGNNTIAELSILLSSSVVFSLYVYNSQNKPSEYDSCVVLSYFAYFFGAIPLAPTRIVGAFLSVAVALCDLS